MQNSQRELAGRAMSIDVCIENLEYQHLTRQMHEQIRRVTNRRKTTQTTGIMDKHDNMCFEKEALVNVWIKYIGEVG